MNEEPDLDLYRPEVETAASGESPTPRPVGLWIAIALFVVVCAIAAYLVFYWRPASAPQSAAAPKSTAVTEPLPPLGGEPDRIALPPLDASDTLVRTLVQRISESPAVMAWLPTAGLVRNFTVVVTNIAEGATPAKLLKVLKPSGSFRVVQRGGGTFVDPRSYDRYNSIADAVTSIDPTAAAKLYATLKPLIEQAHRDLGGQNESFDRTLQRSIAALLDTPIPDAPPQLRPKGIGYAYADDRLENLTAAQRQLLRMGPRNARIVQRQLRQIALALGVPASRIQNP
jgi:hypothetical protein